MSKIICDLCGTSYPETDSQCPICGTAKTDASKRRESTADNYAYVRGGRFTKENVRKRNSERQAAKPAAKSEPKPAAKQEQKPAARQEPKEKPVSQRRPRQEAVQEQLPSNKGLIIVVVILLLAIISVCAFIAIKFISLNNNRQNGGSTSSTSNTRPQTVLCTGVSLSQTSLEFTSANKTILLQPILQPSDTTEMVFFSSSNDNVAKVDTKGLVTPVADGEATIYVVCGGFQAECKVVCRIGVEPTQPTNPSSPTNPSNPSNPTDPTDPVDPDVELVLNRKDFTLTGYGATWNLANAGQGYKGPDPKNVTWISEDPSVATVENGVVTAKGNGKTTIRAEYNGKTATCIVRCSGVTVPQDSGYALTTTDATLKVGEQFTLSLLSTKDSSKVNGLTFQVEDSSICTVNDKGQVKGLAVGVTKVFVEYQGVRYECIIRVKEAPEN